MVMNLSSRFLGGIMSGQALGSEEESPGLMSHEVSRLYETSVYWHGGQRRKSRSSGQWQSVSDNERIRWAHWEDFLQERTRVYKESPGQSILGRTVTGAPPYKVWEGKRGHHPIYTWHTTHKRKKKRTPIIKQAVMESRETRTWQTNQPNVCSTTNEPHSWLWASPDLGQRWIQDSCHK